MSDLCLLIIPCLPHLPVQFSVVGVFRVLGPGSTISDSGSQFCGPEPSTLQSTCTTVSTTESIVVSAGDVAAVAKTVSSSVVTAIAVVIEVVGASIVASVVAVAKTWCTTISSSIVAAIATVIIVVEASIVASVGVVDTAAKPDRVAVAGVVGASVAVVSVVV